MQGIDQIKGIVRRNAKYEILVSSAILAFGMALLIIPLNVPKETRFLIIGLGGIIIGLGLYFLVHGIQKLDTQSDPVIEAMGNEPRKIVWFYSYMVINRPFGVKVLNMASIFFYFKTGNHVIIRVEEKKLEQTMNLLRKLLPHATVGYSIEKEQLYKANPRLLYRD